MKEIHRTEIVVTLRRVSFIYRDKHGALSEFPPEEVYLDGGNACVAEIESIERRRAIEEAIKILVACLDQDLM